MSRRKLSVGFAACITLIICAGVINGAAQRSSAAATSVRGDADLVLHSGVVWAGIQQGTSAEAVAISGKRITAVGSNEEVLEHAGEDTRRIDLGGSFVAPGFRDQHTHLLNTAAGGAEADAYRPEWTGYDAEEAKESRKEIGDEHVHTEQQGDTPVSGCTRSEVTPELKEDLLTMQEEVAKQGLGTVVEAGLGDLGVLDALNELEDKGKLKVRFLVRVDSGCVEEAAEQGLETGSGSEWVKILGAKLYADGWLGPRTSALQEPYSDRPYDNRPPRGVLFLDQERANEEVARAREHGFNVTTHAIGDRATEVVLSAYENAGVTMSDRYAIEHVQVSSEDLMHRMAKNGIIGSIQFSFATTDQRFAESALGEERVETSYAWKTMLEEGVRLAGGSDFGVEALSPLWGLQRVVTRQEFDGTPPGGWHPEERLDLETALNLITAADAYASFEEDERGTVEAGNYADLVVIRENLLQLPENCLASATVEKTITNGRIAFEGEQAYPPSNAEEQADPPVDGNCPSGAAPASDSQTGEPTVEQMPETGGVSLGVATLVATALLVLTGCTGLLFALWRARRS